MKTLWLIGAVINGQRLIREDKEGNVLAFTTKELAEEAIKGLKLGEAAFAFEVDAGDPLVSNKTRH